MEIICTALWYPSLCEEQQLFQPHNFMVRFTYHASLRNYMKKRFEITLKQFLKYNGLKINTYFANTVHAFMTHICTLTGSDINVTKFASELVIEERNFWEGLHNPWQTSIYQILFFFPHKLWLLVVLLNMKLATIKYWIFEKARSRLVPRNFMYNQSQTLQQQQQEWR
jgi:hypothetical protein